jgi:tRNA C32,U32 (ribose-2'-O)-methylase TrmJ
VPLLPFKARNGAQDFADLFRRVFGRTQLESRDINLFLKLFELIQKMPAPTKIDRGAPPSYRPLA